MATTPDAGTENAPPNAAAKSKRKVGVETVLGVAGALAVLGFFLPWMDLPDGGDRVSGLDIVRGGGIWLGLAAIPVLGLATAVFGFLRWKLVRYAGIATAIAMIAPAAYLLVMHMPLLYAVPLVLGATAVVLGKLSRGLVVAIPLGAVLLLATIVGPLVAGDDVFDVAADKVEGEGKGTSEGKVEVEGEGEGEVGEKKGDADEDAKPEKSEAAPMGAFAPAPILSLAVGLGVVDDLGVILTIPLGLLSILVPLCGVWLLWTGVRQKGRARPLVVSGWVIIALDAYVAALVVFGPTLHTGGIGLWMTVLGGSVLLLVSAPLRTRRRNRSAKASPAEDGEATPSRADKKAARKKAKEQAKAEAKANAADAKTKAKAADAKTKAKAADAKAKPADAKTEVKSEVNDTVAADNTADDTAAPPPDEARPAAPAPADDVDAAAAAAARAKKLARHKELRARKAAADAEQAKRGAAKQTVAAPQVDEPEPQFAADPTAPPAPENESREALMQRMGVKKPPPPTETELEAMLADLKKRAGDDS